MAHAEIPKLDRKGLRHFGLTMGGVLVALFGLAIPYIASLDSWPRWPWLLGGLFAAWGLLAPTTLKSFYTMWMKFGLLLNRVMTPLILGLVFYLLVCPTAVFFRLFGGDPMGKQLDERKSFRTTSQKPPRSHMEKPF